MGIHFKESVKHAVSTQTVFTTDTATNPMNLDTNYDPVMTEENSSDNIHQEKLSSIKSSTAELQNIESLLSNTERELQRVKADFKDYFKISDKYLPESLRSEPSTSHDKSNGNTKCKQTTITKALKKALSFKSTDKNKTVKKAFEVTDVKSKKTLKCTKENKASKKPSEKTSDNQVNIKPTLTKNTKSTLGKVVKDVTFLKEQVPSEEYSEETVKVTNYNKQIKSPKQSDKFIQNEIFPTGDKQIEDDRFTKTTSVATSPIRVHPTTSGFTKDLSDNHSKNTIEQNDADETKKTDIKTSTIQTKLAVHKLPSIDIVNSVFKHDNSVKDQSESRPQVSSDSSVTLSDNNVNYVKSVKPLSNLAVQKLPSVDIRGSFVTQKIPNLVIHPEETIPNVDDTENIKYEEMKYYHQKPKASCTSDVVVLETIPEEILISDEAIQRNSSEKLDKSPEQVIFVDEKKSVKEESLGKYKPSEQVMFVDEKKSLKTEFLEKDKPPEQVTLEDEKKNVKEKSLEKENKVEEIHETSRKEKKTVNAKNGVDISTVPTVRTLQEIQNYLESRVSSIKENIRNQRRLFSSRESELNKTRFEISRHFDIHQHISGKAQKEEHADSSSSQKSNTGIMLDIATTSKLTEKCKTFFGESSSFLRNTNTGYFDIPKTSRKKEENESFTSSLSEELSSFKEQKLLTSSSGTGNKHSHITTTSKTTGKNESHSYKVSNVNAPQQSERLSTIVDIPTKGNEASTQFPNKSKTTGENKSHSYKVSNVNAPQQSERLSEIVDIPTKTNETSTQFQNKSKTHKNESHSYKTFKTDTTQPSERLSTIVDLPARSDDTITQLQNTTLTQKLSSLRALLDSYNCSNLQLEQNIPQTSSNKSKNPTKLDKSYNSNISKKETIKLNSPTQQDLEKTTFVFCVDKNKSLTNTLPKDFKSYCDCTNKNSECTVHVEKELRSVHFNDHDDSKKASALKSKIIDQKFNVAQTANQNINFSINNALENENSKKVKDLKSTIVDQKVNSETQTSDPKIDFPIDEYFRRIVQNNPIVQKVISEKTTQTTLPIVQNNAISHDPVLKKVLVENDTKTNMMKHVSYVKPLDNTENKELEGKFTLTNGIKEMSKPDVPWQEKCSSTPNTSPKHKNVNKMHMSPISSITSGDKSPKILHSSNNDSNSKEPKHVVKVTKENATQYSPDSFITVHNNTPPHSPPERAKTKSRRAKKCKRLRKRSVHSMPKMKFVSPASSSSHTSEGEIKLGCKCDTSIGESHLCRYANLVRSKVLILKRNPETLFRDALKNENVKVTSSNKHYDNWVTYSIARPRRSSNMRDVFNS